VPLRDVSPTHRSPGERARGTSNPGDGSWRWHALGYSGDPRG